MRAGPKSTLESGDIPILQETERKWNDNVPQRPAPKTPDHGLNALSAGKALPMRAKHAQAL